MNRPVIQPNRLSLHSVCEMACKLGYKIKVKEAVAYIYHGAFVAAKMSIDEVPSWLIEKQAKKAEVNNGRL